MPPALLRGLAHFAALLEKILPLPPKYTAEALRVVGGATYYGNSSKAKRELSYAPRSLEEGMRDVYSRQRARDWKMRTGPAGH